MRRRGKTGRVGSALLAGLLVVGQLFALGAVPAAACDRAANADVLAHLGGSVLNKVVTDGTHAFAAADGAFVVFDVSDPHAPKVAGELPLPGNAEDVALQGDFAYVVGDWGDLQVVDITTPTVPVARGSIGWGGAMHGVAVSGDRAYVTSDGHGFKVIDVSNVDEPGLVAYVSPPNEAQYYDVALTATKAFVSWGRSPESVKKVREFDISDPDAEPVQVGSDFYTDGTGVSVRSLVASGALVFAAEAARGLDVIDFSTPSAPVRLSTYLMGEGGGFDLTKVGDALYAAGGDAGLDVLDVSSPSAIGLLGSLGGSYTTVGVSGGIACLGGDRKLTVADVSNPAVPGTFGSVELKPGDAKDVAIAGDSAIVSAGSDGLLKVSLDATGVARIVGGAATSDAATLAVGGDYAYVADGENLRAFDISGDDPVLKGGGPFDGHIEGLAVDGGRLYVAAGDKGLLVYSLTDPADPALLGSFTDPSLGVLCDETPGSEGSPGAVHAVAASGGKVYIGCGEGRVLSLDASDPANVTELDSLDIGGAVRALSLDGDRLWAGTEGAVYQVDATDPTDVFQIGESYWSGNVTALTGLGGYAYAGTDDGFKLVDFSDAANPYEASKFGGDGMTIGGVAVADSGVVWVAAREAGLYALSVPVERTSGPTRYDTAVELSKANWDSASWVVLATGANFADAACAAPLANALGGPLLLVPQGGVPQAVLDEISRLAEGAGGIGNMHVVIIGSPRAVPGSAETALSGLGVTADRIERLAGWNRYDTARLVALRFKAARGGVNPTKAFLATGDNFPDALSVSGIAAELDAPVLLVRRSYIPTPTAAAIEALGNPQLIAVGSSKVISDDLYRSVGCKQRLWGAMRYDTAKAVADFGLKHGFTASEVIVTSGLNFPDALVSGVVSAKHGSPILLTSTSLPDATDRFISDHHGEIKDVTVVGSSKAVSQDVENQLVDALTY